MLVIGLSGGIGSGKTVASDHFASLGVPIIDTDLIARQIVEPGKPALAALVAHFGPEITQKNGHLDRSALRELAFASPANKAKLDSITHPAIRQETLTQIQQHQSAYCIVVVPLLTADSPFRQVMERVLIVTAEQEIKIKRVKKRSGLSREDILRIMATQLSDEARLAFADDVIENNTSLAHVYAEVEGLHQVYLALAEKNKSKESR